MAGYVADAVARFADFVFGFVGPIAESVFGVFVAALQVAPHLFAGFGSEQKASQGSGSQSNQKESNGGADVAAV